MCVNSAGKPEPAHLLLCSIQQREWAESGRLEPSHSGPNRLPNYLKTNPLITCFWTKLISHQSVSRQNSTTNTKKALLSWNIIKTIYLIVNSPQIELEFIFLTDMNHKNSYSLFADQWCVDGEEVCARFSVCGDEDRLHRGRAHGRRPAQTHKTYV